MFVSCIVPLFFSTLGGLGAFNALDTFLRALVGVSGVAAFAVDGDGNTDAEISPEGLTPENTGGQDDRVG